MRSALLFILLAWVRLAHGQRPDPRDVFGDDTGDSGLPMAATPWWVWVAIAGWVLVACMLPEKWTLRMMAVFWIALIGGPIVAWAIS